MRSNDFIESPLPSSARFLSRCQRLGFYALTALMAYIAATRLAFVFPHLAMGEALDLGSRAVAVARWFGGDGLYAHQSSTYPPASYLLLWPLLGALPFAWASQIWAALSALCLGWLSLLCARHEALTSHSARWFAAMTMLSLTATSSAIWLGQLVPLVLAAVLGALFLLHPPANSTANWKRELAAGALLLFALVKPSVVLPFLWMVIWSPVRLRVGIGVAAAYGLLTLAALWFQQDGAREVAVWAQTVGRNNADISEGYSNLRPWLAALGLKSWSHPLAGLAFVGLGIWTYRHRHLDRLLLLSVTALVARLWTYHNLYDDMLLIFPMLLLLQISSAGRGRSQKSAGLLLVTLILLLLLPPNWLFEESNFGLIFRLTSGVTMVSTLLFLLLLAKTDRISETAPTKVCSNV